MAIHPGLHRTLEQFAGARILCAGDVMLDQFIYGEVSRISPEGPVPVIQVTRQEAMLGGAGNVVRNLCSLQARVEFATVAGDDSDAGVIAELLGHLPNCKANVIREPERRTSVKCRYVSRGQHLLRADFESVSCVNPATFEKVLAAFEASVPSCDVVVLSDYGKGVLLGDSANVLISVARAAGKPVIVDPKGRNYERYCNATVIKPNLRELVEATGMPADTEDSMITAAQALLQSTTAEAILVTLGAQGMMLVTDGDVNFFTSQAREVFDVSGAGDTVAATLAAALGAGAPLNDAVYLSNLAAGLVVTKVGTAVVETEDLLRELERVDHHNRSSGTS